MNQFRSVQLTAALLVSTLIPVAVTKAEPVQPLLVQPHGSARERLLTSGACSGCDLRSARLQGAHLIGADLRDADLRDADLTGANLEHTDFAEANLTDTNFGDGLEGVYGFNGIKILNLQTELAEKDAKITSLEDRMTALEAQVALLANAGAIQQLQEQIAELSQRPTLEEVRDARAGSVVLTADRENNEVTLNLRVEETDDLKQGTWTTAEGGDLKLTLALAGDKRFMRLALSE